MVGAYAGFLTTSFRAAFAYRAWVVTQLVRNVISVLVQIALWRWVFRNDPDQIRFMSAYVVASQLLGIVMRNGTSYLVANRVVTGDFAFDLLKPVSVLLSYEATALGQTLAALLTRGAPLLVGFGWAFFGLGVSVGRIALALALAALGFLFAQLVYLHFAYLSFLLLGIGPVVRIFDSLAFILSGAVVPLAFFPAPLAAVASWLPFSYLYSLPIRALLGDLGAPETGTAVAALACWIVVLALALALFSRRAVRHAVVQGG
jgi:ABC-2 type transport system permease protein